MVFPKQNTPRWIIFLIDTGICLCSIILAYYLRFNFALPPDEVTAIPKALLLVLLVRTILFIAGKTYAGIIRYTSTRDALRVFIVISAGSIVFGFTNVFFYYFVNEKYIIPFSIIIIDYISTVFALISFRVFVKVIFAELQNNSKAKTNVIIFGAGEAGLIAKRALERDAGTKYTVLAFIDDDTNKIGKKIEDISIYSSDKLDKLLETNIVAHVILSVQKLNTAKKRMIIETCLAHRTKVLNVPPVSKWINGELSFKQIKKININDLLEREPIRLDEDKIKKDILGRNILITGAAGSIGSELARQIALFQPKKLILLDQAETPLYNMDLEMLDLFRNLNYEVVLGDVRNHERMKKLFATFHPEIVFHAAAYKHVPMMENNPSEAIFANVEGTKILADIAVEFQVDKFVMISTDKAVNPTSIMGASKRIAEIYVQSLGKKTNTKFITTRFGNVLGSNGSVIPLFKKQIENGGPITVTHEEVTRYFMTIPEACQLVLEAGAMGQGGEIFVFDMGKSVKIVDLAKKMIMLSGLTLGKDINIVYTGLRPGEKLYEELLSDKENTLPTHHPQIMIAKVRDYDFDSISGEISMLIRLFETQDNGAIVKKMKSIVPEYLSQNSVFEKLDVN
jgi:FlaA1/EpsC-like NDP-sugar epimerase